MPDPDWFAALAAALRADPRVRAATLDAPGRLELSTDGRAVQVDADRLAPRRVAVWAEVTAPAGLADALVWDACAAFTAERAVRTGWAMGYNARARLVLVGRSVYAAEFGAPSAAGSGPLTGRTSGRPRARRWTRGSSATCATRSRRRGRA